MIKVIQIIAFLIASVLCTVIECEGNTRLKRERELNYPGKVGSTFCARIKGTDGLPLTHTQAASNPRTTISSNV
jgi:hypothetical protein